MLNKDGKSPCFLLKEEHIIKKCIILSIISIVNFISNVCCALDAKTSRISSEGNDDFVIYYKGF